MNRKIPFQELAARLAVSAGLSEAESENFIKHFFDTIQDGLLADGTVTVKGLGTFAIDKSVSDPVSFIPDEAVRSIINAPFAQFEPEILNDEVTESMLSDADVQIEKDVEIESEQTPQTEPEAIPDNTVTEEVIADDEDEEPVYIPLDSPAVSIATDSEADEPVVEADADADTDTDSEVITIDEEEEEHVSPHVTTDQYDSETEPEEQGRSGFGMGFLIGILVGLAVGATATFFYTNLISDNRGSREPAELVEDEDALMPEQDADELFLPADSLTNDTVNAAPSSAPVDEKKETIQVAEETTKVVTDKIRSGYLMTGMAQKHYGNRTFWVYIYQENKAKIKNPNNLHAGLELVIPSPGKYGIDSKSETSLKKAEALEREILSSQ